MLIPIKAHMHILTLCMFAREITCLEFRSHHRLKSMCMSLIIKRIISRECKAPIMSQRLEPSWNSFKKKKNLINCPSFSSLTLPSFTLFLDP